MEKGVTLAAFAEEAEQAAVPNLLQNPAYAEQALSYGGMNKTLSEYADMCPLDLNDPRISTEAINSFAVKFINKAGGEVQPQDADYFRSVLASKGIEPQFKVAEPREQPEETAAATKEAKQRAAQEKARNAAAERAAVPAPAPKTVARYHPPEPERAKTRAVPVMAAREDEYAMQARLREAREASAVPPAVPALQLEAIKEAIKKEPSASGPLAQPGEYQSQLRVQPDTGTPLPQPELRTEMSKISDAAGEPEPTPGPTHDALAYGDATPDPGERLWLPEDYVAPEVVETEIPAGPAVPESMQPGEEATPEHDVDTLLAGGLPVLTSLTELLGEALVARPAHAAAETGEPQPVIPAIGEEIVAYAHEQFAEAEPERELYIIGLSEEASQIAEFLAGAPIALATLEIAMTDTDPSRQVEDINVEQALQRLDTVCGRILQELEIPYDTEKLRALRNTFIMAAPASAPKPEGTSAVIQPDEGTHESKLDIWLDDFMGQLSLAPVLRQFAGSVALRAY